MFRAREFWTHRNKIRATNPPVIRLVVTLQYYSLSQNVCSVRFGFSLCLFPLSLLPHPSYARFPTFTFAGMQKQWQRQEPQPIPIKLTWPFKKQGIPSLLFKSALTLASCPSIHVRIFGPRHLFCVSSKCPLSIVTVVVGECRLQQTRAHCQRYKYGRAGTLYVRTIITLSLLLTHFAKSPRWINPTGCFPTADVGTRTVARTNIFWRT